MASSKKKKKEGAQLRGLVAKVLALNVPGSHMDADTNSGSPCFPSSSLLVAWKKQLRMAQSLGQSRVGDPEELFVPSFGLAQLQPLQSLGE